MWIVEKLADFCRWRARAAMRRIDRNMASAAGWLGLERAIIRKGMGHGTKEESGH